MTNDDVRTVGWLAVLICLGTLISGAIDAKPAEATTTAEIVQSES